MTNYYATSYKKTLSDKRKHHWDSHVETTGYYEEEDVKEFIKKIKRLLDDVLLLEEEPYNSLIKGINKLAGEELSK